MPPSAATKTISIEKRKVFCLKSETFHNLMILALMFQNVFLVLISWIFEKSFKTIVIFRKQIFNNYNK